MRETLGSPLTRPSSVAFLGNQQGAGQESEQLELEPVFNADMAVGTLAHCATTLTPSCNLLKIIP